MSPETNPGVDKTGWHDGYSVLTWEELTEIWPNAVWAYLPERGQR